MEKIKKEDEQFQTEHPDEKKERPAFERYAEEIVNSGLSLHESIHDKSGSDPKEYHTSEHPRSMIERAEKMADKLHCTPGELAVIKMAIAYHDTVIEYNEAPKDKILGMIARHRGSREGDAPFGKEGNEAKSAELVAAEMRKINEENGEQVFTDEQIQNAVFAIEATYPGVDLGKDWTGANFEESPYYAVASEQNPKLGELLNEMKENGVTKGMHFFQPHLETALEEGKKVPKEVLLTALSDMGAAGLSGKEEFFREGDAEMREVYGNLRDDETMKRLMEGTEPADSEDREKVTNAFLSWLDGQKGFAMWQAIRFEKIIFLLKKNGEISEEEEAGLREQFSHYEENIKAVADRAEEAKEKVAKWKEESGEKEAFTYIATLMGYKIN